ncbi:MAG: hypothetical protein AAF719_12795 [Pseudomonadota bacterium]
MKDHFIPGGCLACLGRGASLSIWAIRLCASGGYDAPGVYDHLIAVFGAATHRFVRQLDSLSAVLGRDGSRVIILAPPSFTALTHHEATLLEVFEASQKNQETIVADRIASLIGRPALPAELAIVQDYAAVFIEHGLAINSLETFPPSQVIDRSRVIASPYAGHA